MMKYLVLIFLFFVACNSKQETTIQPMEVPFHECKDPVIVHDTIIIRDTVVVQIVNRKKIDSLLIVINKKNDSLFVERFRLERVKYYNKIVQKNKSQVKFLSGWITRAVK